MNQHYKNRSSLTSDTSGLFSRSLNGGMLNVGTVTMIIKAGTGKVLAFFIWLATAAINYFTAKVKTVPTPVNGLLRFGIAIVALIAIFIYICYQYVLEFSGSLLIRHPISIGWLF